jgi:hypothetical protein
MADRLQVNTRLRRRPDGRIAPGSRGPGRRKGSKNIATRNVEALRAALISAVYREPEVFHDAFSQVLKRRPLDALRLVASVVPRDVMLKNDNPAPIPPLVQSMTKAMDAYAERLKNDDDPLTDLKVRP